MKEFQTAVTQAEEEERDDRSYPFVVDGVECRAYRPKDGQLAVLVASNSRHSSMEEKMAGLINFFVAVLDDESHTYIVNRLLDRRDDFGITQITAIFEWLMGEWTGRPTQRSSASTQSQKRGGQKSTQPTQELTSSDSPRIAS